MTSDIIRLGDLLRRHGLHLKKRLGQNFLADPVHLDRIAAAAELEPGDVVLEIGPGVGTLTARLASQARQVVAVELDADLLPALRETLAPFSNVVVVQGDILQLDVAELVSATTPASDGLDSLDSSDSSLLAPHASRLTPHASSKVVANLPYYITSAAIRRLLTAAVRPELIVLTVQREVAQRIVARPPEMSLLAVSVQFYAQPEIVARIPAGAFYPPPKVDSAILRLRPWPQPPVDVPSEEIFFDVVRAGFGQRRKQLRNSLKSGLSLPAERIEAMLQAADVVPERRAETLTLAEWARVAASLLVRNASPD